MKAIFNRYSDFKNQLKLKVVPMSLMESAVGLDSIKAYGVIFEGLEARINPLSLFSLINEF